MNFERNFLIEHLKKYGFREFKYPDNDIATFTRTGTKGMLEIDMQDGSWVHNYYVHGGPDHIGGYILPCAGSADFFDLDSYINEQMENSVVIVETINK